MNKLFLGLLLFSSSAFAATSTMSPTHTSPPPLTSTTPVPEPKKVETHLPRLVIHPSDMPKKSLPQGELFYHPGIVTSNKGQWVGGDSFVNISNSISLQVNIVKPEDLQTPFKKEDLIARVTEIFGKAGITINNVGTEFEPPLPFFNLMILIFPVQDGVAAAFQGRLFESVTLKRIVLEKNTLFQAVTWEQTNLIVSPDDEFEKFTFDAVDAIANSFSSRFSAAAEKSKK